MVSTVMRDCHSIEAAISRSPPAISRRGPSLSVSRPAIGPAAITTSVVGRKRTPVSSGL